MGLVIKSLTIAVRYSCIRKQFGPSPGIELPIIEYQTQVINSFNKNKNEFFSYRIGV